MIAGDRFPELLQGSLGGRVGCEIAVQDAPRPNLHHEEHKQHSKPSGNDNEEIADHNGLSMIADERPPALGGGSSRPSPLRLRRPVSPDGTRGNIDAELQRQLGGHASLPPGQPTAHDCVARLAGCEWL